MRQPAVVERPNLLVLMERNAAPSGGTFGNRMGKSRRMRLSNRPGTINLLRDLEAFRRVSSGVLLATFP